MGREPYPFDLRHTATVLVPTPVSAPRNRASVNPETPLSRKVTDQCYIYP